MTSKLWLCKLILPLSLVASATAQTSEDPQHRPIEMRGVRLGLYMAENNLYEARILLQCRHEINLSADQVKSVESLMIANEERSIRDTAELKILELKFAALLKDNKINRKDMEKTIRDIGQARTTAQIKHLNYLLDLRELLTTDQINKMEQLREQMRKKMPGRIAERFQQMQEHNNETRHDREPPALGVELN
jgi:hypothetical protein